MTDSIQKPKLRFNGFSEQWKSLELSEILSERKAMQKISPDAPILAFAAGQGVIDRSERKTNNRDHLTHDPENKIYKLTEYDDLVYNPANLKYGAIDRNKHGRGVISPIYVTFTTNQIASFIEWIIKDEKFKNRALQYEEGTVTKRQSVKPENLLSLTVSVPPSLTEQKSIGKFLESIDILIKKTEVKYTNLQHLKQTMLEKMFPKDSADVPEIRSKKSNNVWVKTYFVEALIFKRGNGLSKNDIDDNNGLTPCILYGNLYTDYNTVISKVKHKTNKIIDNAVFSKIGDILIPASDTTPTGLARALCILHDDVMLGGDINILHIIDKNKIEDIFLAYCINANKKKILPLITGTTVHHLHAKDIQSIDLLIPHDLEEQINIANYFRTMENLEHLYQQRLINLNSLKKALLERMFV